MNKHEFNYRGLAFVEAKVRLEQRILQPRELTLARCVFRWRRRFFSRFGTRLRGYGGWFRSNHLFLLLDQAAHSVGRLGAFGDPVFGAFHIERTVLTGLLRIVRADDFDEFPVPRAAAIGHHHPVVRPIFCAFSA